MRFVDVALELSYAESGKFNLSKICLMGGSCWACASRGLTTVKNADLRSTKSSPRDL